MANNGSAPDRGNKGHLATYESFMKITKWSIIFVVTILVLLGVFVVRRHG
jgi:hypothetical protein